MRTRCPGGSRLRGRRRGRPASLSAARHAAGLAPHAAHHAALERQHGAAAERDQQTPRIDEALQLGESAPADTPGDVCGLRRRAETRSRAALLERHRAPRLGDPLNLLGELQIDVAVKQNVVPVPQPAGADVLVPDIDIRYVPLIERVARPADRVGVGPGYPQSKPRHGGGMARHVRNRAGARKIQSLPGRRCAQRSGQTRLRGEDPGPGRVIGAIHAERPLGDRDPESGQLVARLEQPLLSGVFQQVHRTAARHLTLRMRRGGECREVCRAYLRIRRRDRRQMIVGRQLPGNVVVGLAAVLGVVLGRQQVYRVVAVRLVESHDVGACREPAFLEGEVRRRTVHLDALRQQSRNELRNARRVTLPIGNQEREWRFIEAAVVGMQRLEIVIPQQALRLLRAVIERREHRGLVVVDVVARRPGKALRLRRRQGPIPLDAALVSRLLGDEGLGGAIAVGLVAATIGVVIGRDCIQVQVRKVVAEIPGPHARHAERRQRLHFMEAQLEAFGVGEWIDMLVDGAGAIPGHQQRHTLVQVVDHLWMPLLEHAEDGFGGLVYLLVRVAVDVHERILRPVGRRLPRQLRQIRLAFEVTVEPLDLLVASVGIRDRVDQHHQILANAPDHRLLRHGEPVGEFQHRLGRAGLVRVQCRVEIVNRAGTRHDTLGRSGVGAARIRQRGSRGSQPLQLLDALFVRHREQHDVAAFLGAPDREQAHARGRAGERATVRVGGRGIHQLACRARDAVQKSPRRNHSRGRRQIGDPGREKARLGRRLRDLLDRAGLGCIGSAGLRTQHARGERNQAQ